MNALDARATVFQRVDRPDGKRADGTLAAIAEAVKSDKYADQVAAIRAETDPDRRKALKLKLPAALFSGRFKSRRAEGFIEHSGVVVLDFDDTPDLDALRRDVNARSYVAASFVSPSGNGQKALVSVAVLERATGEVRAPQNEEEHALCWAKVAELFETGASAGLVDPSGKDLARACYLSHDPEAYTNPHAEAVVVELEPPAARSLPITIPKGSGTVNGSEVPLTLPEIAELLDRLPAPSPAGDYDYWLSVSANSLAFAAEHGHTPEDARALLERWSPARSPKDYKDRGLTKGHAGAFVNLLKDAGLDYKRWLRERYQRHRSDASQARSLPLGNRDRE